MGDLLFRAQALPADRFVAVADRVAAVRDAGGDWEGVLREEVEYHERVAAALGIPRGKKETKMAKARQVKDESAEREADIKQYVLDIGVCKEIARELFPKEEIRPEIVHGILDALPPLEDENGDLVKATQAVLARCYDRASEMCALLAPRQQVDLLLVFSIFECLPTGKDDLAILDEDVVEATLMMVWKCAELVDRLGGTPSEIFAIFGALPEGKTGNKILGKMADAALAAYELCAVEVLETSHPSADDFDFFHEVYARLPKDQAGRPVGDVGDFLADFRRAKEIAKEAHGEVGTELVLDVYDRLFGEDEE